MNHELLSRSDCLAWGDPHDLNISATQTAMAATSFARHDRWTNNAEGSLGGVFILVLVGNLLGISRDTASWTHEALRCCI